MLIAIPNLCKKYADMVIVHGILTGGFVVFHHYAG